ncbi:MAG: peptidoglycan-associated outer rane lipoprotein [Gammaproteobacteria bacterium]|jgi:outer membrane protein OmpA-like peptidoglycan-associated protein|nr:peptidoglycan-associated outer rane lipoprotein [Gammaproteobacteria bacterium]
MNKLFKVGVLAASVLTLTACSSATKPGGSPDHWWSTGSSANNGTQVHGVAGTAQFNGQSTYAGLTAQQQAAVAGLPKKIYFGFDKYELNSQATAIANQNAQVLLQNPSLHVLLSGNTDPRGSQDYNFHLGQRRANAVKDYFMQQGVSAQQICTVSYGELRPAANPAQFGGNVEKAYSLDRRTEIVYGQTCQGSGQ